MIAANGSPGFTSWQLKLTGSVDLAGVFSWHLHRYPSGILLHSQLELRICVSTRRLHGELPSPFCPLSCTVNGDESNGSHGQFITSKEGLLSDRERKKGTTKDMYLIRCSTQPFCRSFFPAWTSYYSCSCCPPFGILPRWMWI